MTARLRTVGVVLALLLLTGLGYLVAGTGDGVVDPVAPPAPSGRTAAPAPSHGATTRAGGLARVGLDDLPAEARRTVGLIERDGPFPYPKDGATFGNRERLLPAQRPGYYREYTVPTPGSDDRGARRLIAGEGGELFYTDDHYATFVQVVR